MLITLIRVKKKLNLQTVEITLIRVQRKLSEPHYKVASLNFRLLCDNNTEDT
jgi:hypothetical protein